MFSIDRAVAQLFMILLVVFIGAYLYSKKKS